MAEPERETQDKNEKINSNRQALKGRYKVLDDLCNYPLVVLKKGGDVKTYVNSNKQIPKKEYSISFFHGFC